ncbi:nuclease-related domain-containing protein [Lysinibacillus xylanilyticus]|uniref:nuclease-related domain-containing protein n=1 Tax=Lysinibacillus xylanilyticus TaxID=582475 RepID=UPI0036DE7C66
MKKDRDLSRLFAKGQQLETSVSTSSIFSKDSGLHLISYKVAVGGKTTVIDNIAVYGSTILVLESKNYTMIEGEYGKPFWRGKGARRYFSIHNPINQNQYHVKILNQYLVSKGLKVAQFNIQHYVIVPDKCQLDVCSVVRKNLLHKSELDHLKNKLAFNNPEIDPELSRIIKEALF